MSLTHFSLFSGIGGADLASEWAGFETVGQVEFADYPTKVLEKHWPNVPRWRDIRDVTGDEIKRVTGLGTVTVLSGGFPCQPFSVAGKRKGKDDDRFLWPEMLRVMRELQPTWVIGENVEGLVRMEEFGEIIDNLERSDYEVGTFVVSAYCSKALFDGKRTFIVATSNNRSESLRWNRELQPIEKIEGSRDIDGRRTEEFEPREWGKIKSRPYGVANGVPSRMDRLKCLGNAIVPQQIYPLFKYIAEIENKMKN